MVRGAMCRGSGPPARVGRTPSTGLVLGLNWLERPPAPEREVSICRAPEPDRGLVGVLSRRLWVRPDFGKPGVVVFEEFILKNAGD